MKFQQHFRYYLALVLAILLAVGVRMQAAPLGVSATADASAPPPAAAGRPGNSSALAALR